MYCRNCGQQITKKTHFCSKCGSAFDKSSMDENKKNTKNFSTGLIILFNKHKKMILTLIIILFFIMIGIILFGKFYDFTKINWDFENGDVNVTHTQPTTINLFVLAFDKQKNRIKNFKFNADAGKLQVDGDTVKWKLPNKDGVYVITAQAPSGKKITKKINVIVLDDNSKILSGVKKSSESDETDSDNDGLTDVKEKELGTNPYSADSDEDGLPDKFEIDYTKTDPLNKDTDGDKINDGDELDLGLDPLKVDSKGDGIKDSDRVLTYSINESKIGVSVEITGQGNIASTTIDKIENTIFGTTKGLTDNLYNFFTNGNLKSAVVTIKYDADELQRKGLNENNLTLYYFNEDTKNLESVPTIVDSNNKTISATLTHFSKYIIGDSDIVLANYKSQIMFIIDNSVSMYSTDQMIAAGYNESSGAIGNDTEFKRLTLTNKMIEKFTGNYQFGISEFSGNYVNLLKFSDNKSELKKTINSMKSKWKSNADGTNIISALKNGINEFKTDNNSHYIVLLTDGKDTFGNLSWSKKTIISNAKNKDVKICIIGLGTNVDDKNLNDVAESTGCDYYNATDSSALDEIYSIIGSNINYNLVDTDDDNKVDGMIQSDSNFLVKRDGFSFDNFSSNKSSDGHCYGMATFAKLYYKEQLPLSLGTKETSKFFLSSFKKEKFTSNGYDLSNTYFSEHKSLYDFKIINEGLSLFLNDFPADARDRIENDTWMIKKEYYDALSKIGATFITKKYKGNNGDFSKYQSVILNIDSEPFNSAVSLDESQLINAIWRLFILQTNNNITSFSSNPDQAFSELYKELNNKTPIVIIIDGNHAINAIRLIQDINDSNKFKIEVYDNNYSGETRYIEVTRNKYSKFALDYTAWTNEYNYKFKYDKDNDGIAEDISVSLDHVEIN